VNLQTRALMSASAAFLAALGTGLSFLPQELLSYAGSSATGVAVVLVQATGALYLGFAILNWMSRGVIIGGIYARPVALGNFMHFAVVSTVLVKYLLVRFSTDMMIATVIYVAFATWFGLVLFTHPIRESE
jgi:hypothetical protein